MSESTVVHINDDEPDFSPEDMLALWKEGSWDDCRKRSQIMNCDMYGWDFEEEGDFTQDHKYQYASNIIKHMKSGRCFEVSCSRSGSYHTDWYYTYDNDPVEVRKVEKVIKTTVWEAL